MELVTFELSGCQFALPASVVSEIVRVVAVTPLPNAPSIVEGVINLRGTVVPALDIRQRFGLPPCTVTTEQHQIIARAGPRLVALRVDRALEIVSVDDDVIQPAANIAPGPPFITGVATLPDRLVVIHDLQAFLSLDEAKSLDAAVGAATDAEKETP